MLYRDEGCAVPGRYRVTGPIPKIGADVGDQLVVENSSDEPFRHFRAYLLKAITLPDLLSLAFTGPPTADGNGSIVIGEIPGFKAGFGDYLHIYRNRRGETLFMHQQCVELPPDDAHLECADDPVAGEPSLRLVR